MPLKQEIADKKAKESALRRNPEVDAKLDAFIKDNPKLMQYYQQFSKDELIRKAMLAKLQRNEVTERRSASIKEWVEANPSIKTKIEERLRNVPEEHRERAFIAAAKSEAANQTLQTSRGVRA